MYRGWNLGETVYFAPLYSQETSYFLILSTFCSSPTILQLYIAAGDVEGSENIYQCYNINQERLLHRQGYMKTQHNIWRIALIGKTLKPFSAVFGTSIAYASREGMLHSGEQH